MALETPYNHLSAEARDRVAQALETFLDRNGVRRVIFAEASVSPPPLAYVTSFPRLTVPLSGCYPMEIAHGRAITEVSPEIGEAVFVPRHCWDLPRWNAPVQVLTFLFGTKQIGLSLVSHDGTTTNPAGAVKTTIHGPYDDVVKGLLAALVGLADGDPRQDGMAHHLAQAVLYACLHSLKEPVPAHLRKASHTYEAVCFFVQEHYQQPLTRETVAEHFGMHPSHVSRLFRQEGSMQFSDYVSLVRIERAKFLLKNYNLTLKEVAANCGFGDVAYFCRVFRTRTKVTPTEYRLKGL